MPTVIHELADAFLRRKQALAEKDQAKTKLAGSDYFMPKSAKEDLNNRLSVFEQGGLPELLKQGASEMYRNPIVNTALGALPVAGEAMLAGDIADEWKQGNYKTAAALAVLGLAPGGAAGAKVIKQLKKMPEGPRAQALREAEEYGQKLLGLPPGNTPLERAKAMGFENSYHGTADVIEELNPSKYGSATKSESAKKAFWSVSDPETARGYSHFAATNAPVQKEVDLAYAAEKRGDWDAYDKHLSNAEQLESDIYNQPLRGQNIMPLMVNTKNAKRYDLGGQEFTDIEGGINQYIKQGQREGKDVVVLENLSDDPGRSGMAATHYAALNPAAVRSKFAAFDPRYANKPGLMLGVGAAMPATGLSIFEFPEMDK